MSRDRRQLCRATGHCRGRHANRGADQRPRLGANARGSASSMIVSVTAATIVAMGGGGFSMEPENPLLDDYLLSLAGTVKRPRICFVPTASGDSEEYIERFHQAFPPERAHASVLSLFRRDVADLHAFLLTQDVVYVGGGNTANLLAVWKLHGLGDALRGAARAGVILAGIGAGMNCWFEASVTDSLGPGLQALHAGLGMLSGSACPHYDGEAERRPTYLRLVAGGSLPGGYAADDGCALVFRNGELVEAVSSRPGARAFAVTRDGQGAIEARLPVRFLGRERSTGTAPG